jgi:ABC-type lipoprotein export system ATPase subunit
MAEGKAGQPLPDSETTCSVEAHDLWRVYKLGGAAARGESLEVPALRGVSFSIPTGNFVAVKGRSGSGKTTLLNLLGGLDQPTSGKMLVLGEDLSGMSEDRLTRWRAEQVGIVFQSFGLLPTLSAYENVELALRMTGKDVHASRVRAVECLEMVGLSKRRNHRPYELSGGQQQRVAIARALANRPKLVLADEPTGELDSSTSREIFQLFRQLVQAEGMTMVMASHDALADQHVDRVIQLKDGQILAE